MFVLCVFSLLIKICGKHFKVFHKFVDPANEFDKLFSLYFQVYVYFNINIYVYMCILCLYQFAIISVLKHYVLLTIAELYLRTNHAILSPRIFFVT